MQFDELLMFEVVTRYPIWKLIPYLYVEEIQGPLGYVFLKFAMIFGQTTFAMRLPSILFTLLTPWAFYKLARLSFEKDDALKASALLMFFYPIFMYSGSMRPYLGFIFFTCLAFHQFLRPDQKTWKVVFSLIALCLIHPLGAILSYILAGLLLFKKKEGKIIFSGITVIGCILASLALYFRQQNISDLLVKFTLLDYYRALYNFSFLISGREFFAFVLFLFIYVGFKKYVKKDCNFKVEKFWFFTFGWSIVASLVLMLFFGKHVYPRHFMFLLPGLALIVMSLINSVTDRLWARNTLLVLGVLLLTYKSIGKEQLASRPFELDSASIAEKSLKLSESYYPVVACGNCFHFYIKERNHLCTGSHLPKDYFHGFDEAVYIELDYVKPTCGLDKITRKYQIVETGNFIGGKVHKLKFEEN